MKALDRRVLLVTGKGGVGKTVTAAAIAAHHAAAGQRVLLVETQGASRAPQIFGTPDRGYDLSQIRPNLATISVDSESAIEDYLLKQLKVRALYKLVFRNRIMVPFMRALPGLHDLIQLGKVFELEQARQDGRPRWDRIVIDAPATGHGLTMLDSPQAMMDLTRTGPFHENARQVRDLFADPDRVAIVLVSLPEEMPVNETLSLHRRLGAFREQITLCVLNETVEERLNPAAWQEVRPHLAAAPQLEELVGLGDHHVLKLRRQRDARERLVDGLNCPLVELPLLPDRDLTHREVAHLGNMLMGAA